MFHITKSWLLGSTCVGLALSSAASAQDDSTDLGTLLLGESKREVQTQTATSVTVVDETEIKDRQAGTIAGLIDSVPGVNLINGATPVGSGINIRGFGANSTFGTDNKTLIQIDGVTRGAEEFYRNATQLFTDPYLFKEVTVIRGATGSFEFGSGVVGGAILLETIDASDVLGGELGFAFRPLVEYRSNGQGVTRSGTFAWAPTERAEFLFNYTQRELGIRQDGSSVPINPTTGSVDDPTWLLKGKLRFGSDNEHSIEASYTDAQTSQFNVPFESFTAFPSFVGNVDRFVDSTTLAVKYAYNPVDNDLVDFSLQYSFADEQILLSGVGSIPNPFSPFLPPVSIAPPCAPGDFVCATFNADQVYETTTVTAKNRSLFTTGALQHNLVAGVEYQFRDRPFIGQSQLINGVPSGHKESWAIFVVDEIDVGNWTFTPAIRYEDQRVRGDETTPSVFTENALMGGLSARYAFNNGAAVFGSVAYTEVLPIIDDVGTPARMISEKALTYEVGGSYDGFDTFRQGDRLAVKANVYFTDLDDGNSFTGFAPGTTVDEVETVGLEVEASYETLEGYYADFNGQIVDATETLQNGTAAVFRGITQDNGRLTIGRKFASGVDISWEGIYGAGGRTNALGRASDFFVNNLRLTIAPDEGVWKDTEFRLSVENVFDRTYRPLLSARQADGRNFIFSVARKF
ncbi:MAG: TonB-dependent receptor plug domain-containing protein [Pseudomonadota bacterium]